MSDTRDLLARIDSAERRLSHFAETPPPPSALTRAEPSTGERWDAGQAWAHLAEFVPYWLTEAQRVADAANAEPVAFGRVQSDPDRIARIAEGRRELPPVQMERLARELRALRSWLTGLAPADLQRTGVHQTRGPMSVREIIDRFIAAHLEEHAAQLGELEMPEARR